MVREKLDVLHVITSIQFYDHNNNICQASTLSSVEITKIKQVFFLTLKYEMWSYLLLL